MSSFGQKFQQNAACRRVLCQLRKLKRQRLKILELLYLCKQISDAMLNKVHRDIMDVVRAKVIGLL